MNAETHLEKLGRDIQYLMDRIAILDCISLHAREYELQAADLFAEASQANGIDKYRYALSSDTEHTEWVNAAHAIDLHRHTHNVTAHICEIDGDVAHCESNVLVCLLSDDGKSARILSGRYIDRLERCNGDWKIALRRAAVDLLLSGDAAILRAPIFESRDSVRH